MLGHWFECPGPWLKGHSCHLSLYLCVCVRQLACPVSWHWSKCSGPRCHTPIFDHCTDKHVLGLISFHPWAFILSSVWPMVTVLGPGSINICWLVSHLEDPLDQLGVSPPWILPVSGRHLLIDTSLATQVDNLLTIVLMALHWLFCLFVQNQLVAIKLRVWVLLHLAHPGQLPPTWMKLISYHASFQTILRNWGNIRKYHWKHVEYLAVRVNPPLNCAWWCDDDDVLSPWATLCGFLVLWVYPWNWLPGQRNVWLGEQADW